MNSLWLHLVGKHADPMAVVRDETENEGQHQHEHHGPGTIRDHDVADLTFHPTAVRECLSEWLAEEFAYGLPEPPFDENHHRYHTPNQPLEGCANCRYLGWLR